MQSCITIYYVNAYYVNAYLYETVLLSILMQSETVISIIYSVSILLLITCKFTRFTASEIK